MHVCAQRYVYTHTHAIVNIYVFVWRARVRGDTCVQERRYMTEIGTRSHEPLSSSRSLACSISLHLARSSSVEGGRTREHVANRITSAARSVCVSDALQCMRMRSRKRDFHHLKEEENQAYLSLKFTIYAFAFEMKLMCSSISKIASGYFSFSHMCSQVSKIAKKSKIDERAICRFPRKLQLDT